MSTVEGQGREGRSNLDLIALRITEHLKRFEADTAGVNTVRKGTSGVRRFYQACAWRAGAFVQVKYIGYQGHTSLRRKEAMDYLNWLDEGNVGTHYQVKR